MIEFSVVELILRYTNDLFRDNWTYHRLIGFLMKLEINLQKRRRFDVPITIYDLTTKDERKIMREEMRKDLREILDRCQ